MFYFLLFVLPYFALIAYNKYIISIVLCVIILGFGIFSISSQVELYGDFDLITTLTYVIAPVAGIVYAIVRRNKKNKIKAS